MLVISKESVQRLKQRIDSGNIEGCPEELEKMIEIKDTLLWRSDWVCGCIGTGLSCHLAWEIDILERTRGALTEGKNTEAAALLEKYMASWNEQFDETGDLA